MALLLAISMLAFTTTFRPTDQQAATEPQTHTDITDSSPYFDRIGCRYIGLPDNYIA